MTQFVLACPCPHCALMFSIEHAVRAGLFDLAESLTAAHEKHFPEAAPIAAHVRSVLARGRAAKAEEVAAAVTAVLPAVNARGCAVPS